MMNEAIAGIERVVAGRPRDLGGFSVRRLLPAPGRRTIGPFIFFDHMGPARFAAGHGVDVRPHPHIGLATVTYLFSGSFMHRDSLGTVQLIEPGAVNWMVAGRGIAHSERTPPELRTRPSELHGIQTWIALPVAREEDPPSFAHHPAATLPQLERDGAVLRVIAGHGYGARSPVAVASPTLYVDARLAAGCELELPDDHAERAVYVAEGGVGIGSDTYEVGQLVEFTAGAGASVTARSDSRVLLLGGAPLDGSRHIWWNFVSSSQERIERASRDWDEHRFETVPGDPERIPLPER
jgi:redox-sensitive bicupin YhaK (pirin superfamily)